MFLLLQNNMQDWCQATLIHVRSKIAGFMGLVDNKKHLKDCQHHPLRPKKNINPGYSCPDVQCFYYTYLLLVKNGPPVDSGHPRHVVNLLVDLSVEGAVLQPALMEVNDTGVRRGQKRCKGVSYKVRNTC